MHRKGGYEQTLLAHQPQHAFLVDQPFVHDARMRAGPEISPKRMLCFQCLDASQHRGIVLADRRGATQLMTTPRGRFLIPRMSSLISILSPAFSCWSRAARSVCWATSRLWVRLRVLDRTINRTALLPDRLFGQIMPISLPLRPSSTMVAWSSTHFRRFMADFF